MWMKQDWNSTNRGIQVEPELKRSLAYCQRCAVPTVSMILSQEGPMTTEKGKSKSVQMRGVRRCEGPP